MYTTTLRRFVLVSILIMFAPVPLFAVIALKSGDWLEALAALAFPLALCLSYWWPLGASLAWYRGSTWMKLLYGYLLSLPLYFLPLALLYPAVGATFRPFANGTLPIYLSATPQFFGAVGLLFYLTRRLPRAILATAASVSVVGVLTPFVLMIPSSFVWPEVHEDRIAIVKAHLVDVSARQIEDGRTVYIRNGWITE